METKDELEQFVLLDAEYKLLSRMKRKQLHPNEKTDGMHALLEWRFAAFDPDGHDALNRPRCKDTCHITERGERYLAYRKMEKMRFLGRSAWIPLAVSIAASILTRLLGYLAELPR